jgi:hypothetical protein
MADKEKYPVQEPIRNKIIGSVDRDKVNQEQHAPENSTPVTTDPIEGANYADGKPRSVEKK